MNRLLLGYSPDLDLFDDPATPRTARPAPPRRRAAEAVASEIDSTGQAADLLEAGGTPGLAACLAGLLQRAARAAGGRIDADTAAALVAVLQPAALQVLPAHRARAVRPAVQPRASRFFGVEFEGLSPEDVEFEAARRFVQLTAAAARHAVAAADPRQPAAVARRAVERAARRHAPGWVHGWMHGAGRH